MLPVFQQELWVAEGSEPLSCVILGGGPNSSSHQRGFPLLAGAGEPLGSKTNQPSLFLPMLLGAPSPATGSRKVAVPNKAAGL